MKKTILISLILSFVLLVGCSSNNTKSIRHDFEEGSSKASDKIEEAEDESSKDNNDKLYEDFLSGKIPTSTGEYISDYIFKDEVVEYLPSYYYIQSKNAKDKALVISYALGASVSNDIIYAHDGNLEIKAYFGRNAISGTLLVDETYLEYGTTIMDCNAEDNFCEFYLIRELDENYDPKDVVLALDRAEGCTVEHKYQEYVDGEYVYLTYDENTGFSDPNEYLKKVCGADVSKEYYDAPDFAIEINSK